MNDKIIYSFFAFHRLILHSVNGVKNLIDVFSFKDKLVFRTTFEKRGAELLFL